MSESGAVSPPTVVSILICDQIIDDKLTHKKSAIGLFNMVLVPRVPVQIQQMIVLVTLTEITAHTPLELRLANDSDNEVIFSTRGVVEAPNPLAMVDLVFGLRGVELPQAGPYAFEVLCNSELLSRRRFAVMVARPAPPAGGPQA